MCPALIPTSCCTQKGQCITLSLACHDQYPPVVKLTVTQLAFFDRRDFTILPNYWQKIITFSREEHGPVATGGRERSFIQYPRSSAGLTPLGVQSGASSHLAKEPTCKLCPQSFVDLTSYHERGVNHVRDSFLGKPDLLSLSPNFQG
ncbi:hypothetical protein F9C07_10329 [Aspergillus flavus]|uniref:Uncharacterized protein n=2 Tax=Aspergillus subgen. Circumdati TaxID=2720871 RepID=A0A7U2QZU3_ASPFN|nr:hypothetical protein Ao3042_03291 [Aspergillus oryzae 3.042]KDE78864.1 hypothetical protein AO1008_05105 [Aspergillus oryzae 100-8]KOC18485.1 hypothetical protein AFLA70_3g008150 [Aspergillus flavus AF70]QRD90866.1 hypothetical protein F9C07_10329 [Aspergillus flavus]|eukprot:EIT80268.1 hypothetical protein Ao3042_03291 [Aspergillus oryzae 3.042]